MRASNRPNPFQLAESLRDKAAALAGDEIAHALVARYDPGAGIGWHKDRNVFDRVVGISLNTPAVLRFRQRTEMGFRHFNLTVEPRSAYLLSGEARYDWEHRIVPGDELRFSITFRTMSDIGRRKAAEASAQLEAGEALGNPARRCQRAEVGRIERRIPFGQVDERTRGSEAS